VKTRAAVVWGPDQKWKVDEVDLDGPKESEVMVKMTASGLCHSDHHVVTGSLPMPFPIVGGHEGAGVVVDVGPGVTDVVEGDHVVLSFIPACGRCQPCSAGMSNLCELGMHLLLGPQLDGTYRFHARGRDLGQNCVLGTFADYTVVPMASVIKIDPGVPLHTAALVGCGVTTGYGSAGGTVDSAAAELPLLAGKHIRVPNDPIAEQSELPGRAGRIGVCHRSDDPTWLAA
jgi:Zn-dependent alcohol dehydrogenase